MKLTNWLPHWAAWHSYRMVLVKGYIELKVSGALKLRMLKTNLDQ